MITARYRQRVCVRTLYMCMFMCWLADDVHALTCFFASQPIFTCWVQVGWTCTQILWRLCMSCMLACMQGRLLLCWVAHAAEGPIGEAYKRMQLVVMFMLVQRKCITLACNAPYW